jgi:hypothetical protein
LSNGTYALWVRQKYTLLPTDPRFLALRTWECELEFWVDTLWQRLLKRIQDGDDMKAVTLDVLTAKEQFEEKLAAFDAQLEQEASEREAAAPPPPPLPAPTVPVITFRAP